MTERKTMKDKRETHNETYEQTPPTLHKQITKHAHIEDLQQRERQTFPEGDGHTERQRQAHRLRWTYHNISVSPISLSKCKARLHFTSLISLIPPFCTAVCPRWQGTAVSLLNQAVMSRCSRSTVLPSHPHSRQSEHTGQSEKLPRMLTSMEILVPNFSFEQLLTNKLRTQKHTRTNLSKQTVKQPYKQQKLLQTITTNPLNILIIRWPWWNCWLVIGGKGRR